MKKERKKYELISMITSILYFLCAIIWFIKAIININDELHNVIINFALTIIFIVLGFVYLKKKSNK